MKGNFKSVYWATIHGLYMVGQKQRARIAILVSQTHFRICKQALESVIVSAERRSQGLARA